MQAPSSEVMRNPYYFPLTLVVQIFFECKQVEEIAPTHIAILTALHPQGLYFELYCRPPCGESMVTKWLLTLLATLFSATDMQCLQKGALSSQSFTSVPASSACVARFNLTVQDNFHSQHNVGLKCGSSAFRTYAPYRNITNKKGIQHQVKLCS